MKRLYKARGVDPRLIDCAKLAEKNLPAGVSIMVLEGRRSEKRQAELFVAGATKTMNSKHLTGNAIDLGVCVQGRLRWDWPLYFQLADAMRAAACALDVPIRWGGCWMDLRRIVDAEAAVEAYRSRKRQQGRKPFCDGPHYELSR